MLLVRSAYGQTTGEVVLRETYWPAVEGVALPPELAARSAILIEAATNTVLYAKSADLVIPPASLTKVVAIDVALAAVAQGELDLHRRSQPSEAGLATSQPPRSSLMFLRSGQLVSLHELLLGLSVSSGNDAAVEVAARVSGSMQEFARRMERSALERGIVDMRFVEPSGISDRNSITARAFGRYLLGHLADYPTAIERYYEVDRYLYPGSENLSGTPEDVGIEQANRNGLLRSYPGADGFKTGYIPASGYNIAVTASREGRRLIVVLLGVEATTAREGSSLRERDAATLLDYGFEAFENVRFAHPELEPIRVYGAAVRFVSPSAPGSFQVTIPRGQVSALRGEMTQVDSMVRSDSAVEVGNVSVHLGDVELVSSVITVPPQEPAGFVRRIWDSIALAFARLRARINGVAPPLVSSPT